MADQLLFTTKASLPWIAAGETVAGSPRNPVDSSGVANRLPQALADNCDWLYARLGALAVGSVEEISANSQLSSNSLNAISFVTQEDITLTLPALADIVIGEHVVIRTDQSSQGSLIINGNGQSILGESSYTFASSIFPNITLTHNGVQWVPVSSNVDTLVNSGDPTGTDTTAARVADLERQIPTNLEEDPITVNFTAVGGSIYPIAVSTASIVATLPYRPDDGTTIQFYDHASNFSSYPLVITPAAGDKLKNLATSLVLTNDDAAVAIRYSTTTENWSVISDANSSTGGGTATGNGSLTWVSNIVTSTLVLSSGSGYFVNTSGGSFSVTLPSTPDFGDVVVIKDIGGNFNTQNLVVGSAHLIGTSSTRVYRNSNIEIRYVYSPSGTWTESITSSYTPNTERYRYSNFAELNLDTNSLDNGIYEIDSPAGSGNPTIAYKKGGSVYQVTPIDIGNNDVTIFIDPTNGVDDWMAGVDFKTLGYAMRNAYRFITPSTRRLVVRLNEAGVYGGTDGSELQGIRINTVIPSGVKVDFQGSQSFTLDPDTDYNSNSTTMYNNLEARIGCVIDVGTSNFFSLLNQSVGILRCLIKGNSGNAFYLVESSNLTLWDTAIHGSSTSVDSYGSQIFIRGDVMTSGGAYGIRLNEGSNLAGASGELYTYNSISGLYTSGSTTNLRTHNNRTGQLNIYDSILNYSSYNSTNTATTVVGDNSRIKINRFESLVSYRGFQVTDCHVKVGNFEFEKDTGYTSSVYAIIATGGTFRISSTYRVGDSSIQAGYDAKVRLPSIVTWDAGQAYAYHGSTISMNGPGTTGTSGTVATTPAWGAAATSDGSIIRDA